MIAVCGSVVVLLVVAAGCSSSSFFFFFFFFFFLPAASVVCTMGRGSATDHLFMVGGLKAEGSATAASSTCLVDCNNNRDDDSGNPVFFSSASSASVQQAEAVQLYYAQQNPDFSPHGYSCSNDGAASGPVTVLYSAPVAGGGGAIPASAGVHHEQLMLPCSQLMIQEQCFVPLLPAQAETHESRHLRATPVYASNQGSPCGYLTTSATENQAAYGNWWNGTNVAQEHHLLQAAGTEEDASAGRSASVHDLGQLHRETLVGDGSQGLLALSLSSQYQPQTSSSSLHLHSGRQALYAGGDVEMNTGVAAMSQTAAQTTTAAGVAVNDIITQFSSRSYPAADEPRTARVTRFRTPAPRGDDPSRSAIRHESELAGGCGGSAGRSELLLRPQQVFEFCNGSRRSDQAAEDISRIANCFATSRFLRAAQELLVEVCRVVAPMKRSKSTVHNMTNWPQQNVLQAPRNFSENMINMTQPAAQTSPIEFQAAAREPAQMGLEISSSSSAPLTLITYHPQCVAQSLVNTTAGNETREALLLKKENLLAILNEVSNISRDSLQMVVQDLLIMDHKSKKMFLPG